MESTQQAHDRPGIIIPLIITEFSFWRENWPILLLSRMNNLRPREAKPSPQDPGGGVGLGCNWPAEGLKQVLGTPWASEANDLGSVAPGRHYCTFWF